MPRKQRVAKVRTTKVKIVLTPEQKIERAKEIKKKSVEYEKRIKLLWDAKDAHEQKVTSTYVPLYRQLLKLYPPLKRY